MPDSIEPPDVPSMPNPPQRVDFVASLPPLRSAVLRSISPSGQGAGMQVKLDVVESQMGRTVRVQLWPGKRLLVTTRRIPPTREAHDAACAGNLADDGGGERLEFEAMLAPARDAVQRSGNGDGLQIKLAVPEEQVARAIEIQMWTGENFAVTMQVLEGPSDHASSDKGGGQSGGQEERPRVARRTSAKQRVRRGNSRV